MKTNRFIWSADDLEIESPVEKDERGRFAEGSGGGGGHFHEIIPAKVGVDYKKGGTE